METSLIKTKNKEITNLKRKLNNINTQKNFYKKKYNEMKDEMDKIIEKEVAKRLEKEVNKLNHQHKLELMKKNQKIFELTNIININSKNSSLPSSRNPIYIKSKEINKEIICNSRKKTNRHIGGQPNHKKYKLEKFNDNELDKIIEHTIDKCPECDSENLELINIKERDIIDIEIRVIKTRHKFYNYKCLDCGKLIKSKIPFNLHAENQYGSTVQALALSLTNIGYVSINRTKQLINSFTNNQINMSEGYIAKLQKKVINKVDNFVNEIRDKILQSRINYWDDTVVKIGKLKHGCFRTYTNDKFVYYTAHSSKSVKGLDEDGILRKLPSSCYVMHDHIKHNYNKIYKFSNLECNAHITRKLESITQTVYHDWSREMKNLIELTYLKRKENIRKGILNFKEEEIVEFDKKYDQLIELGYKEYQQLKEIHRYKKEENLLNFMKQYKENITAWVRDYSLPYSNNLSERTFRFLKSKLKISYQFKDLDKTKDFAKIMSYTETCGRFKVNKFEAMKKLFDGRPYTITELEMIPTTKVVGI